MPRNKLPNSKRELIIM